MIMQEEKKKKFPLAIIIVVIMLLCCGVSTIGGVAGWYFLIRDDGKEEENNDNEEEENDEENDEENNDEKNNDEENNNYYNNNDDDDDDDYGFQPNVDVVIDAFSDVKSYTLYAESTPPESEMTTIEGKYQYPGKEYVMTNDGFAVAEEYDINGQIYFRAQGGTWEKRTTAELTGFHDSIINDTLVDFNTKAEKTGEYYGQWEYMYTDTDPDTGEEMEFYLYVDMETNLPSEIYIYMDINIVGYLSFEEYNSDIINIQAPI